MSAAESLGRVEAGRWWFRSSGACLRVALGLVLPLALAHAAWAQAKKPDRPKLPPAERLDLETSDGVTLKATFLPGTRGKETVPIILLHGFEGSGNEYAALAAYLQSLGHAVLVPDLRGHGESIKVKGATRELKASTMPAMQFGRMVTYDMEKLKSFLKDKNNAGELNIEKLCVVGAGMGAVVAMAWAYWDWHWDPLPTMKQGRDVKALVLVSPEWSYRGLNAAPLFQDPRVYGSLSVLIVVGNGKSKTLEEAKRIHTKFEKYRPEPKEAKDKDLFFIERKTSLQGTKLVSEPSFQVDRFIAQFIQLRLVDQSYPWTQRRDPRETGNR